MGELPYTRRFGAYLFFLLCSSGIALEVFALTKALGLHHDLWAPLANMAGFASFLALRDMTKVRHHD
jgi:hypothetical protein